MPESTEQQPANNKPKQSAYLVCEGALCKCSEGAAPVKLKVDSHKKAFINNNKLLATIKDVKFELPANPFGSCNKNSASNYACQPQFEKWTKPYKDIEVEGNQVITDQSELKCIQFGGTITIEMHGQQQTVNETQANNVDRTIAAQVNPLADFVPLNVDTTKKVGVTSIKGELVEDPKYKSVISQQTSAVKSEKENEKDTDPTDIRVRPNQEIQFTSAYTAGGTAALICWKITGAKGPMHFLQHGPVYKTSFPEAGKYTIEGYGTGGDSIVDVETQISTENKRIARGTYIECMLDILVQDNKLTGIHHVPSENVVAGKVDKKSGVHVRIGLPVTFEPEYLMPPIQEEIDHLILVIKDVSGNEVQRSKGTPNIIFAAQNSSAVYSVEAYFDNSDAKPFTYLFKTAANSVSVIAASGMKTEGDIIRLGTKLTFTVSKFKFENDVAQEELVNAELANIKWYDNADTPAAIGTTTYSNVYSREGKFVITCAVLEKSAGWFKTKKNEADDWNFTVTRNYPTDIEQKTEGKVKVGKKVIFEMKSIFNVIYEDERTIHWQLTGPEHKTLERSHYFIFTPQQSGKYTLTVSMNGKSIDKTFECITCEIVNGWWTDSDGNILTGDDAYNEPSNTIGFAGWEQEVVATFQHVGLNAEDVTVEVWDSDLGDDASLFKKDMKVPDTKNAATCSVKLDQSIKDKVNSLTGQGLLYFTVKAKNGLKVMNDGMLLPKGSNYLNVDGRVRSKAYFSDNNDTKRYNTAALDTPVFVQVKSTNLIGEELELEIVKSINWGADKALGIRQAFKVDKYGMASIKLKMEEIKPEVPNASDSVSVYVKIYNKKSGNEIYSSDGRYMLTVYKTLATSAASIGTTKAFVVVDASEGEKREQETEANETCGLAYRNEIQCTKYGNQYGPVYWGTIKISSYGKWSTLISERKVTEEEKSIMIAMSENEGNLDSVQSYDSEIVTVGAMQKTMNPQGYGEFPIQMWEFKQEYPDRFKALFSNCGWDVKKEEEQNGKVVKYRAYYLNETGTTLKDTIREGFETTNFKTKVKCIPIEPLINASKDIYFQSKQIEDFIDRLKNKVLVTIPEGYEYKLSEYLKSKLGKATALDHHINRPAHLSSYFGASLNRFFESNPAVSKNPNDWGDSHSQYEKIIVEDYGITRSGTDMVNRYKKIKSKL